VGSLPNPKASHRKGADKRRGKPYPRKGITNIEYFGLERGEEINQNIKAAIAKLDRTGEKNSFFGHSHTDEFKAQMSEMMTGREPANKGTESFGAKCVIDGIEYKSISQAARTLGMTHRKITTRLDSEKYPNFQRILV
jgi:hypothetical protein